MDAIDRVVMNSRLHYLGMAAHIVNPMLKLALITCMDARLDPSAVLGLRPGDAHIIRNAGGRASHDAMHAIAISQAVLGTREVMVLHHTECAMGRFTQAELAEKIKVASGHPLDADLGCFTDPLDAIRQDVDRLRACKSLVHTDKIRGFMYDLEANTVTEIPH
jgi:carbonic anhydrase